MLVERLNCKEAVGGYIGICLKWSDDIPAQNIRVQLGDWNGKDNKGYTDSTGLVRLYNNAPYCTYIIYINGDRYEQEMKNGNTYTFYIRKA